MKFNEARLGYYVQWSRNLEPHCHELPIPQLWTDEDFDCVFEVSSIVRSPVTNEPTEIELDCVMACGCHGMTSFSAEEYEEICNIIGDDLLHCSSDAFAAAAVGGTESLGRHNYGDYDIEQDAKELLKRVI